MAEEISYNRKRVKTIIKHLGENPDSYANLIEYAKNFTCNPITSPNDSSNILESVMNAGWNFWRNTVPAITSIGQNFLGSGVLAAAAGLYMEYGPNKQNILAAMLSNGLLEELLKLDNDKILQLYDIAVASGSAKAKDKAIIVKALELIKESSPAELADLADNLANYFEKNTMFEKGSQELQKHKIAIISTAVRAIKTPTQLLKFQELTKLFIEENQTTAINLKLSSKITDTLIKISPLIIECLKHNKQIDSLINCYNEYNSVVKIKKEFTKAHEEMLDAKDISTKAQVLASKTITRMTGKQEKLKHQLYNIIKEFIKYTDPKISETRVIIKKNRDEFVNSINELLNDNPGNKIVIEAKKRHLNGNNLVEFIERITSPKGKSALLIYLETPNPLNLSKVLTDSNLLEWAANLSIKVKLSDKVNVAAAKLAPTIAETFKYTEQIKKLIKVYEEYDHDLKTTQKSNLTQDATIRKELYQAIKDFMESISPQLAEINHTIKTGKKSFANSIDDLLKDNSSHDSAKQAKKFGIEGTSMVEFLEKITTPKGQHAVLRYLDNPTRINYTRIFTDAKLMKWAASRIAFSGINNDIINQLSTAINSKSIINAPRKILTHLQTRIM